MNSRRKFTEIRRIARCFYTRGMARKKENQEEEEKGKRGSYRCDGYATAPWN